MGHRCFGFPAISNTARFFPIFFIKASVGTIPGAGESGCETLCGKMRTTAF